ncbi:hypothetical protein AB0F18_16370 [Streptomyces sp. NPDC029216]|uniref:hypothetical protein n=1 Tax=Streptomyces sp. NPDC029216 TaxID=3154701 RepID=UPI0033F65817
MNASTTASPLQAASPKERTRFWAVLAAVFFLPAAVIAMVLALASEQTSRCVTYGEQCAAGLPFALLGWSTAFGALALVVALAAPAVRLRQTALTVQVFAECTALLVILSHA